MKYSSIACLVLLMSCADKQAVEQRLARQHCGSCHVFPDPALLDKQTWDKHVLPQMAFRMGLDLSPLMKLNPDDAPYVIQTLPKSEMVTQEEFESIRQYFLREAPDSLAAGHPFETDSLVQFTATPMRLPNFKGSSIISMVSIDTTSHQIWIGTRSSKLISYAYDWSQRDSITMGSPPSSMVFREGKAPFVSAMGIMDPNDQPKGSIIELTTDQRLIVDSLKRPVYFEEADLNGDGRKDLVICAFGNYSGELVVMENFGDGYYPHTISYLPGARKVIVRDFNDDGRPDILTLFTQGDEQISLLTNAGNFNFRITTLLRFNPVTGSSYFEVADFNGDGQLDILYTNGDNADYSIVLKPYHGVHIFLNDGKNQFKESWFHPMPGASKAIANDFDRDGDLDIAAISFFPDFATHPERGFMYFRNDGHEFSVHTTAFGAAGRWLVMDIADIDGDKDQDLLLGALNFNDAIPRQLSQRWTQQPVDILVLKNNQYK